MAAIVHRVRAGARFAALLRENSSASSVMSNDRRNSSFNAIFLMHVALLTLKII